MSTGLIRTFRHYVPPFTGWFYKSTGNDEADRVNLYDVLFGSPQSPISLNLGSIYASDIDVAGSDIGTFTGEVTDLVDDLDSPILDETSTNPKYFEIKLERPVENASIKFCSPDDGDFSNVKIVLKDRGGTTLYTCDNSSNNTKYKSNVYDWPVTAWCSVRVEFHTTDAVKLNWALIEKEIPVSLHIKHVDRSNATTTPLGASETWTGEWIATTNYVQAVVDIVTDQSGTLFIELSADGVTVDHYHTYNILENTPEGHHYPSELELSFYRLKYTNGGTEQGTFRLFSTLFTTSVEEGHAHGLDFALQDDHPASIVRSVLVAKKPNGDYENIDATTGGNLKISLEELETAVEESLRQYPEGTGSNGAVTLTDANTSYAIPSVAPTTSFRINLYNGSDTSIFVGYEDTNANGAELPPGDTLEDNLGAGQQLYAYCASAGKILTYTYKETV
jgi:hypothetical protein